MNILHIEFSKLIKMTSKIAIESIGHVYYEATTLEEAFKVLRSNPINLIITGLELEDAKEEGLIKQLSQSEFSSIPIVVLTSTDNLELRKKLFDMGVVDYQIKSGFTTNRLKTYIESIQLSDELIETMRGFKIAVVDDSIFSLNVIRNIFELNQVKNVFYFSDPQIFLDGRLDYDLYILDLVLPDTSGEELIYKLKDESDDNIVILISSTSNYKTIAHILSSGANDFIVKPFDSGTFIVRIKAHIRNYLLMKELEIKNKELLELSVTDGLTRIYNHRHIVQLLKDEVSRSKRYGTDLSVLLLDLDNFKRVNDTYGHQVGDEVLTKIAQTIKKSIRDSDDVGRYGGEEFLVVLPNATIDEAEKVGNHLRKIVEALTYTVSELVTTISGGVATNKNIDYSVIIKTADTNLYRAKHAGKNQIMKS